MKTVTIYTDGACSGNPGPGAVAASREFVPLGKMPPKAAKGIRAKQLCTAIEEKCDEDSDNLHRRCVFG